jgi:hypothetical protein
VTEKVSKNEPETEKSADFPRFFTVSYNVSSYGGTWFHLNVILKKYLGEYASRGTAALLFSLTILTSV